MTSSAVPRFSVLVGALLQLLVVRRLLHKVEDRDCEILLGQGVRLRVHLFFFRHRGAYVWGHPLSQN